MHAETSTGVRSDAKEIAEIAKKYDCLVIADTVTSFTGIPVLTDEWGLDAVYSGSQKCLSCVPGLSPLDILLIKQLEKIKKRRFKNSKLVLRPNFGFRLLERTRKEKLPSHSSN